jgi:hypothetical protein
MRGPANYRVLAYSIGASLAIAFAVVAGLMIDNPWEILVKDSLRPLAILAAVAVVGPTVCHLVWRRWLPLFPVALYGLFQLRFINDLIPQVPLSGVVSLSALGVALAVLYFALRRISVQIAARRVLLVCAAMAIGTGIVIAPQLVSSLVAAASIGETPRSVINDEFAEKTLSASSRAPPAIDTLPDIIYVVPDRYPNKSTLLREYGYDNSDFYRDLRSRGFAFTEESWSNYPRTFESLASTLNGGYLDPLTSLYGSRTSDQRPVYRLLEDNIVQDRLRRAGYSFVHFGNWWNPARQNRNADENYLGYSPSTPFHLKLQRVEQSLLSKTMLTSAIQKLQKSSEPYECDRIRNQLERLRSIGNESRPMFIYVHLTVPHPPIVADADGKCLAQPIAYAQIPWDQYRQAFLQYLRFFNREIIDIIDQQRHRRDSSGRELIFVIQSDEGPFRKPRQSRLDTVGFLTYSDRELRTKVGNINAISIPPRFNAPLDDLRTPINNWRLIFNAILDADLSMLPHKSFVFRDMEHIFEFHNISGTLGLIDKGEPGPLLE